MSQKRKLRDAQSGEYSKKIKLLNGNTRIKAAKLCPLETLVVGTDYDKLVAFLEAEPQTDEALWSAAGSNMRCENADVRDQMFVLLLGKIGNPAAFDASNYLVEAAYNGFACTARFIIDHFPFDINFTHSFYGSALCAAARMENTEIALMLLEQPGIDIEIKNANQRSAAWFAACNEDSVLLNKLIQMDVVTTEPDAEDTLPEERTTTDLATVIRDNQDLGIGDLGIL